jgi:hypothetical protein
MSNRWIRVGCIILALVVLMSSAVSVAGVKPKKGPAKAAWDQPFAKAAIAPGATDVLNAVFTPTKDLTDVGFALTPSVKNVLTVAPAGFPAIAAGTPTPITLTLVIPATSKRVNYNGNLWVTVKGKKINRPLHLRFKVLKPTTEDKAPSTTTAPTIKKKK